MMSLLLRQMALLQKRTRLFMLGLSQLFLSPKPDAKTSASVAVQSSSDFLHDNKEYQLSDSSMPLGDDNAIKLPFAADGQLSCTYI